MRPDLCFTEFALMAVGRIEGGGARGRQMSKEAIPEMEEK